MKTFELFFARRFVRKFNKSRARRNPPWVERLVAELCQRIGILTALEEVNHETKNS